MGFIYDNTNTFEVYLTDLGKERFFNGGFKDSITHFSLIDSDSNYDIFKPTQSEVLDYVSGKIYEVGSVVKYLNKFYRKVKPDPSLLINEPPTNLDYWDVITVYNTNVIASQTIPTINHADSGNKTSLVNGSDEYVNEVFTQTTLRGSFVDNKTYKRALFGIKNNTQRSYILYEPDLNSDETIGILTYINI
jgi:hypothetical protein